MKANVKRFKSLKICLKELEPFIRNGEHLQTGKPFKRFGNLRSREILANWLLSVVINFEQKFNRVTLCTDPDGGDGIIYDSKEKTACRTEHILVPRNQKDTVDIELLILDAIEKKQMKGGAAYASGKTLIVFLNVNGGAWFPNKVARKLQNKFDFDGVWIVGLQHFLNGHYIYNATRLNPKNSPIWQIKIENDFSDWEVNRIQ